MMQHNGFIELHLIENTGEHADKIGLLTAEFVHYTDCQQLKVWLPKSEYNKCDYGSYKIVNKLTQDIVKQELVELKVSGNTQMLFDTLCLSDGDYYLEIEHPKGGKHYLHFQKHVEGFIPEKFRPVEPLSSDDTMREMFW